jgi:hypothetical protein
VFLKLNINLEGTQNGYKEAMINLDHVKHIAVTDSGEVKTKLTFVDGRVHLVRESLAYIEAKIGGTLEQGYKAPEPKEA